MPETLTIAFDGEAVRDGSIEVRDLAGSLMALGNLFEVTNETLNKDRGKVAVRIRATGEGSFELTLDVIVSVGRQILDFFNSDGVSGALNLVEVVGLSLTTGLGLVQVMKKLRGRKPEKIIENASGTVTLVVGNESIEVKREVVLVLQSDTARAAVVDFVAPLHRPGIDVIEVRDTTKHSADRKKIEVASKDDLAAIEAPFLPDEFILEEEYKAALTLLTVSFQEQNKWRVTDGDHVFWANVEDEHFLRRIAEHQVVFGKDDVLVCTLKRKQLQTAQGLKSDYTIVQVLEHRRAWRQLHLLPPRE